MARKRTDYKDADRQAMPVQLRHYVRRYCDQNNCRQKAFAKKCNLSESLLSQYLTGVKYPTDVNIQIMAEELGIKPEELTSKAKRYEGEARFELAPFAGDLAEDEIKPYCDLIGLDQDFLKVVHKLTKFDEDFPAWSPMEYQASPKPYIRKKLSSCRAKVGRIEDDHLQLVTRDENGKEKRVFLLAQDLVYLKDLQDMVAHFIEAMFQKRREEMEQEVQTASRRALLFIEPGSVLIDELTPIDMAEIDRGLCIPSSFELQHAAIKDDVIKQMESTEPINFETSDEFLRAWKELKRNEAQEKDE